RATCSTGMGRELFDPGLIGDPVDLPGLAAIGRERLLEVGGGRRHLRPDEADQDVAAVDGVRGVELADAVLELADLGDVEPADLLVRPVDAPLMGHWVV